MGHTDMWRCIETNSQNVAPNSGCHWPLKQMQPNPGSIDPPALYTRGIHTALH